jgi:hypothetical protein
MAGSSEGDLPSAAKNMATHLKSPVHDDCGVPRSTPSHQSDPNRTVRADQLAWWRGGAHQSGERERELCHAYAASFRIHFAQKPGVGKK